MNMKILAYLPVLAFSIGMIFDALSSENLNWAHGVSVIAFIISVYGILKSLKPKEDSEIVSEVLEISEKTTVDELFSNETEVFIRKADGSFSQIKKVSK